MTKEMMVKEYKKVFNDNLGELEGEYKIKMKENAKSVKHAQRKIAIPLQEQVKTELDELERQGILRQVTIPTPWISSLVVTKKKSGKIRLCLDPKDLNEEIERENYPLPTIEDIATKMHKAKVFTVLDVKNGFWHVKLAEESSYLTTFNTPFGRYRWIRMPFGLCSAPEIFQSRMHEMVEGMDGIEVIADDFLIFGCGNTQQEAIRDHDKILRRFLVKCEKQNLHLNSAKVKLRESTVTYIGHNLSADGVQPGEDKLNAILQMPSPRDPTEIKRFLGMVQYIDKFIDGLSTKTVNMRKLIRKDVVWNWTQEQEEEFNTLKTSITTTPMLKYYNVKEEVIIQCDASKYGLGAVLLQQDRPVAYASKCLTETEVRYAQIEKEMLAIVFACKKFRQYIYSKPNIIIHTDHKPLIRIIKKPLNDISTRLQKMRLRLQQYDIKLEFIPGKDIKIADTLSRDLQRKKELEDLLPEVVNTITLAITEDKKNKLKEQTNKDEICTKLIEYTEEGWPNKNEIQETIMPYYSIRNTITHIDGLIFKDQLLIVPNTLRKEMMQ